MIVKEGYMMEKGSKMLQGYKKFYFVLVNEKLFKF